MSVATHHGGSTANPFSSPSPVSVLAPRAPPLSGPPAQPPPPPAPLQLERDPPLSEGPSRAIEERARFGCARARSIYLRARERANARAFRQFPFRRCTSGKGKFNLVDTRKGKFNLVDTSALRACARMRTPLRLKPRANARALLCTRRARLLSAAVSRPSSTRACFAPETALYLRVMRRHGSSRPICLQPVWQKF